MPPSVSTVSLGRGFDCCGVGQVELNPPNRGPVAPPGAPARSQMLTEAPSARQPLDDRPPDTGRSARDHGLPSLEALFDPGHSIFLWLT